MVKHKRIYIKFFNIGEQDIVLCEVCGQIATEIHHIEFKSHCGGDEITNLIGLCRSCHSMAHNIGGLNSIKLSKQCLQEKHNQKILAYQNTKNRNY